MCKHDNTEGFKFCPYCGEKLPTAKKEKKPGFTSFTEDTKRRNQTTMPLTMIGNSRYAYNCEGKFNPLRSARVWGEYEVPHLVDTIRDAAFIVRHFQDIDFMQSDVTAAFDKFHDHITCQTLFNAGLLERVGQKETPIKIDHDCKDIIVMSKAYVYRVVPNAVQYLKQIIDRIIKDVQMDIRECKVTLTGLNKKLETIEQYSNC